MPCTSARLVSPLDSAALAAAIRRPDRAYRRQRRAVPRDLFREAGRDSTKGDPGRFFAADGLYPSDDNHALWHPHIDAALTPLSGGHRAFTTTETT